MVKTSPSIGEGAGSIPGLGAKTPHVFQSKTQNIKQKQNCFKFSKTLKIVHIKKIFKKKRTCQGEQKEEKQTDSIYISTLGIKKFP